MRRIVRRRPSPALVVACVALAIALGGTSYAAVNLAPGSVGTKQLKRSAVTSLKVKDHSLLARDFKAGQAPTRRARTEGRKGRQGRRRSAGRRGPFCADAASVRRNGSRNNRHPREQPERRRRDRGDGDVADLCNGGTRRRARHGRRERRIGWGVPRNGDESDGRPGLRLCLSMVRGERRSCEPGRSGLGRRRSSSRKVGFPGDDSGRRRQLHHVVRELAYTAP